MKDEGISDIDWVGIMKIAATSPMGMIALLVILVSVIGYLMMRGAPHHYRFMAFVMLFGGAGTLSWAVLQQKSELFDTTASVSDQAKAKFEKKPLIAVRTASRIRMLRIGTTVSGRTAKKVEQKKTYFSITRKNCFLRNTYTKPVSADRGWNIDPKSVALKQHPATRNVLSISSSVRNNRILVSIKVTDRKRCNSYFVKKRNGRRIIRGRAPVAKLEYSVYQY